MLYFLPDSLNNNKTDFAIVQDGVYYVVLYNVHFIVIVSTYTLYFTNNDAM